RVCQDQPPGPVRDHDEQSEPGGHRGKVPRRLRQQPDDDDAAERRRRPQMAKDPMKPEPAPDFNLPPLLKVDVPPMAEDRFWALIRESRERAARDTLRPGQDFIDAHIKQHTEVLRRLSPDELIAYDRRF